MALADQYKRRAAECVRMAERTDNAEDKALLLQMAQTWMRLAEKAEDRRERKIAALRKSTAPRAGK